MRHRFENFELNTDSYELFAGEELVRVEPQVFDVLAYLVEHRDRVVPKEELLDEVWGDRFVSESALTTRIKMARRAVGDDGRTQRLIRNSHGRGYQFVGETVSEGVESFTEAAPVSSTEPVQEPGPAPAGFDGELVMLVDEEFRFVGRTLELDRASRQAGRVRSGGSGALLIGGEPGIGKTRLAAEVARRALDEHGLQAMAGRCDRHLASSLQPWLEALGTYVQTAPDDVLLADSYGLSDHLRSAFPSLSARLGASDSQIPVGHDEFALLDALVVLIERVSVRTPLVIVLDDVQWAGGATKALASLLLRRGLARVLLILTFRTTVDDLDEAGRDWLADLAHNATTERIDLGGLESADVHDLLANADIDDETKAQVWDLSGGHTLFATELLRDVRRGIGLPHLPDTVAALVRSRLDRLPPEVSALVSASAAIGPDFSLRVAGSAADLSVDAALEAAETAMEAEIIHEVSGSADRFRFSHQLVPAAVLDSMSRARRVRLHARLAEVIEETGGSTMAIAHHLIEAQSVLDVEDVATRVREAARSALLVHDYDAAAEVLARCVELPVPARARAETLVELARAYNAAGRQPEALQPLERVADSARHNGWPDLLIDSALGRWGDSPFRASQDRTVIPLLDEALALDAALTDVQRARLMAKRAAFNLFTRELDNRESESAVALGLVGPDPTPERLAVLEARWMAIACPTTVHDIIPLDEELRVLRKELSALTTDACAPEIGLYWRGEGTALWALADELEADPRQRRDVDQWRTTTLSGTEALFAGRFDEARELTDAALPLGRSPWGESGRVVHALVHLLIDLLDGVAEQSLDRWRGVAESVPSDSMRSTCAWLEAVVGDQDSASETLDELTDRVGRMADNFMGGFGLVGYSEAAIALGRADLVPMLRSVLEPLSDTMLGHPWAPSFAAADLLARLELVADPSADVSAQTARAFSLYEALGAETLSNRLAEATG